MPAKSYNSGDKIEVIGQDERFKGSFLLAQILQLVPTFNGCSIKYETLVDESNEKLIGTVEESHLWPRPPTQDISQFQIGEKVDALFNDGWWIGETVKVIEGAGGKWRYVCSKGKDKEVEFGTDEIPVHLDWIEKICVLAHDQKCTKRPFREIKVGV